MSANRLMLLLSVGNIIAIWCIALINSVICPWGIFLYLPGLFFLPHYQILDTLRGLICIIICGLIFDLFFNHSFGFHGFLFGLLFLLSCEFFHIGKQSPLQVLIFQGIVNLICAIAWTCFSHFLDSDLSSWSILRMVSDLTISFLLFVPLSLWFIKFSSAMIHLVESSRSNKAPHAG